MTLRQVWAFTLDLIFPLPGAEAEIRPTPPATLPTDRQQLKEVLLEYDKLLGTEDTRRQATEARLSNVLGLSSIAGTIVYGAIVAQAAGTIQVESSSFRWLLGLGSLYLALQICSAILSAVTGLSRRGYLALTEDDVVAGRDESEADYLRRRLTTASQLLADQRTNNDVKITAMANAHRAIQNFIWALLVLALFGTAAGLYRHNDSPLEKAKKDQQLRDLLRGPEGPPGPPGSPVSVVCQNPTHKEPCAPTVVKPAKK